MTLKEAIKEMKDQRDALVKHYNRGGEYIKAQLEATEIAIECMEKAVPRALTDCDDDFTYGRCAKCGNTCDEFVDYCDECGQRLDWATTKCIAKKCFSCGFHGNGGKVCDRYADKVDEIRRIHEEG